MRAPLIERCGSRTSATSRDVELEPAPRFNVISGDNGQGKTSLLEAIYFARDVAQLSHASRRGAAAGTVAAFAARAAWSSTTSAARARAAAR